MSNEYLTVRYEYPRELQRLESLAKGPVVSHLTETLSGLATVRAFGQQRRFVQTMYERMDYHSAAVLVLNSTNRWLGFALVIVLIGFTRSNNLYPKLRLDEAQLH